MRCPVWLISLILWLLGTLLHGSGGPARAAEPEWREALIAELAKKPSDAVQKAICDFPDDRQILEVVADWLEQDLPRRKGSLREAVGRVLDEHGASAGAFKKRADELEQSKAGDNDPRWAELYLDACEARRAARFAPQRDKLRRIVFTKHFDMGGSHYAYTEGQSDAQRERHFQPGTALCVLELDGIHAKTRVLIEDDKGVIRDPDVSFDGRRILFAWKKSEREDDYHLYETDVESEEIRQLTEGLGFADYEGCYLPDGNILFNSTRCVQTVDCWWTEVSNLFLCNGDGEHLRQLSFDQVHTNYPTVTCDGRVIYTRWDYNDRGQIYPQGLFQMYPDGTGQTEVYGNNSFFPTTILHARSIPGTGKIVCIFTGHHTRQQGWLGILEPRRGRQENEGAQLIAPVRETPAVRVDKYGQEGDQFQYPYPLSETEFLVTFREEGAPRFAIYWMDVDGNRELLASDPGISCNQPVPLRPRPVPAVQPDRADYREETATVYLHDVYAGPGLAGVERGTIEGLRVVGLDFRAAGVGSNRNRGPAGGALISTPISIEGAWDVKRVLGTADVHPDGSACFTVPARTPLYFQALDGKGQMVQTMRSWVTLQPGESVSCVGCHESKNTAPPYTSYSQAMRRGPRPLTPLYGPPRGFSFIREIQPILDEHCVRCHYETSREPTYGGAGQAADRPAGKPGRVEPAFSLKGIQKLDLPSARKWSDSYLALADRRVCNWINVQSAPPMLPPYTAGASQSRLVRMLEDGSHYGVKLSKPELDRFVVWIDILVPYAGDYTEAMHEQKIPEYNHFLEKRRRWHAEEAENIAAMLGEGK